jgi:hypothetical protein
MTYQSALNEAMQSQLVIMEHFVQDILINISDAHEDLQNGNRNAAMGSLLRCPEAFEHLKTLHDAIMVMHRNAHLVEREEE